MQQDKKKSHSSAVDFPVNPSVRQEREKVSPMFATCGLKWQELLENYTPLGCLVRMLLGSSMWGSTKRFLTWNVKATTFNHLYIQLVASARGISANELLSSAMMFPTPLASDSTNNIKDALRLNVYLSEQGFLRKKNPNGNVWSLPLSAAVFYLTPIASDGFRSTLKPETMLLSKDGANLASQIIKQELPVSDKAAINPDWVEWLMGFPKGWTVT